MTCPPEIASIVLKIMGVGLLRIRATRDDPGRVSVEADHIHNLPGLMQHFSGQLLAFYWDVERPSFIDQTPESDRVAFEPLWDELHPHVESVEHATTAS